MLNDGMAVIYFLDGHGRRSGRGPKLGSIDNRGIAIGRTESRGNRSRLRRQIADGSAMKFAMSSGGHAVNRDAIVDDVVIHHGVIIHDGSLPECIADLSVRQAMMTEIAVGKIMHGNECEMVWPQAEIEVHPDVNAIVAHSGMSIEISMRWQRSPTAAVSGITPGHPGRSPRAVRCPDPAAAIM